MKSERKLKRRLNHVPCSDITNALCSVRPLVMYINHAMSCTSHSVGLNDEFNSLYGIALAIGVGDGGTGGGGTCPPP